MMRIMLCLFLLVLAGPAADAGDTLAEPEAFGLANLTEYLGLRPDDISFRQDYLEPDSFRLAVVARYMEDPLGMVSYLEQFKHAPVTGQPEILSGILASDLKRYYLPERGSPYQPSAGELEQRYNLYYSNFALNQVMSRAATYIDIVFPKSSEKMLSGLTRTQREFLLNQFVELIRTYEEEEFYTPMQLDSVEKAEEGYIDEFAAFGTRINSDPVVQAGVDCLRILMLEIKNLQNELASGNATAAGIIGGAAYLPGNVDESSYLGKQPGWAVGGPGTDYYNGEYKFILDFGGDDIYDLSRGETNRTGTIIIDLGGNDVYRSRSDFTIGSGMLGVGLLLDFGGDDRYDAKSFGIGSGYFGFGLVYDASGDDRYDGDTHTEGAGTFGLGLLIDEGGRDIYNAALYSQGFGCVEGIGFILETGGSDSYYAGGKYKDILRYEDHFLSLSQGFGYGLRPSMSGGIGTIVDLAGNDSYFADIFAQACSYWFAMGMILDSAGNDSYNAFQYGQGSATHMSLGLLLDEAGNDVYFGKGLMQGVGHDYSAGILIDRAGDDTYTAYDLSQAAGSANGVGILIDNAGEDRYTVRNPDNTQGYGNPRRDFGSIGLFIDLGGQDQYNGNGRDNYYWKTDSKWGGGMDIEMTPPDTTLAEGENK